MPKIYEILKQPLFDGDVGIEIEVEGRRLTDDPRDRRWKAVKDGSLRGESMEYIFTKPLPIDEVKSALEGLQEEFKKDGSRIDFSFRTSVHVHVNCQQMEMNQYLNFIYTYFLLEEPLINFCGALRKGNRFCLRLSDADGVLDTINMLFTHGSQAFQYVNQERVRYASINLCSTAKFGSLEFRAMEGNLDVDRLVTWAKALVTLREFAMGAGTPKDILNMFMEDTPTSFLYRVLGRKLAASFTYVGMDRDMQNSFSLSIDMPFSYREAKGKKKAKVIVDDIDEILANAPRRVFAAAPPGPVINGLAMDHEEALRRWRIEAGLQQANPLNPGDAQ